MLINREEFNFIRRFIREHSAIEIDEDKTYLVELRLGELVRRERMQSYTELVDKLQGGVLTELHHEVIGAMTTNETLFFRDGQPFEALQRRVLPELFERRAGARRLNIWSAACSTGQEPYSLAVLLDKHFRHAAQWAVSILATDLSREVLQRAREGRYSPYEINRGLSPALLNEYFESVGEEWQIKDRLRRMVEFREMNLAQSWPALPKMDIVLMRNVLIYFDLETKRTILEKVHRTLAPDGFLILGSAETTLNISPLFQPVQLEKAVFYRPVKPA